MKARYMINNKLIGILQHKLIVIDGLQNGIKYYAVYMLWNYS